MGDGGEGMNVKQMRTRDLVAGDIMNADLIVLDMDMTLQEAADVLSSHSISGAPVLNENEVAVGVISYADIAQNCAERGSLRPTSDLSDSYLEGWEDRLEAEELEQLQIEDGGLLVKDVMTPTVYTVPEQTPVREMAKTMIAGRVHRLFVTNSDDKLVGVVSTLDLLQLFADGM